MPEYPIRFDEIPIFPDVSSKSGGQEVRVRFYNKTEHAVDVIWMRSQMSPTKYGTLFPRQYLDIRTFEGHPWVFRRSCDGATLHLDNQPIFWPESNERNVVVRRCYSIGFPLLTLFEIAMQRLFVPDHTVTEEEIRKLPKLIQRKILETKQFKVAYDTSPVKASFF